MMSPEMKAYMDAELVTYEAIATQLRTQNQIALLRTNVRLGLTQSDTQFLEDDIRRSVGLPVQIRRP